MVDDRLREALEGIELTEIEERYLEWLSRMDGETVEVFSGLFEKIKKHPRGVLDETVYNRRKPGD